ncbi:MAG: hypothetical protein WCB04_12565 [Mycobacteriales bacterium]
MPTIKAAPTAVAAFVGWLPDGPMNRAVEVASFADVEREFGGLHSESEASFGLWQYFRNGGRRAWVVATGGKTEDADAGLAALLGTDFTILCLPRVLGNALDFCRDRQALMLVDPPPGPGPAALLAWLDTVGSLRDDHSAMYYPRVTVADPTAAGLTRSIGPSGTIAGLMAATDERLGVWAAAAGTDAVLDGIESLDYYLGDEQVAELSAAGVNCLRDVPGYGPVCWGARTLIGDGEDSPYRFVPVRRLACFIESSLRPATAWVQFEPDDEQLRTRLRTDVEDFMSRLFRRGALAGETPADAYFVRCDSSTTPPGDGGHGIVALEVGFAPMRPGQFVVLRIEHLIGQSRSRGANS